jgi:hypothetical protein
MKKERRRRPLVRENGTKVYSCGCISRSESITMGTKASKYKEPRYWNINIWRISQPCKQHTKKDEQD